MAELSQMSDEEFMAAWDEVSKQIEDAKAQAKEFSAEHQRRLQAAEEQRVADKAAAVESGEADPSLDQTVGSPRAGLTLDSDGGS